jgi:hypothetical protein
VNGHARSRAPFALEPEAAAMQLRQLTGERQAEACSLIFPRQGGIDLAERFTAMIRARRSI